MIDEFVLKNVFHHIPATDERDEVWYRSVVDENGEGYIMVWADGNHFHTYRYPPDWY